MQNQRSAYRYSVSAGDAAAMLRTGSGEFVVQVADESAGGWGIFCDPSIHLTEGEVVGFATPRGPSICRVVRVEPQEGRLLVGLFRISDVMEEPKSQANGKILTQKLSKTSTSLLLILAFAIGMAGAMGLSKMGWSLLGKPNNAMQANRLDLPRDPSKRLESLTNNLATLDVLKSRQVIKQIGLTDGQQRKIDNILEKLVVDLAAIQIDRGDIAPEAGSYMGLLMLRRAWTQVEQVMTKEQIAKWDAILDGVISLNTGDSA